MLISARLNPDFRNSFRSRRRVLPGFGLSLGFTLFYLTGIVLIPLLALILRPFALGWDGFWAAIATPRVLASLRLSFGMAALAAAIDTVVRPESNALPTWLCLCGGDWIGAHGITSDSAGCVRPPGRRYRFPAVSRVL